MVKEVPLEVGGLYPFLCSREEQEADAFWVGVGMGWMSDMLRVLQKRGCCKGFFGPDCTQCPGGFSNPCYGKGNVSPHPC